MSLKWLQEILQQHYGECAMKNALVALGGHRSGTQSSLVPIFPVSLLYRTLEKIDGAFNFLLTSRLACVPIDHYCFSDVQQSIVNLLLYHSVAKMKISCSQASLYLL